MKTSFKITRKNFDFKTLLNTKITWGNGMTKQFWWRFKKKFKICSPGKTSIFFILFPFFSFYKNIPAKPEYSTFKDCKLDMF